MPVNCNTLYRKVETVMNEFYEAVCNFLEELRCDSDEREFAIESEDVSAAKLELQKKSGKFIKHLEKFAAIDKKIFEEYLGVLEHYHFKEEQRAYYQGIMDGIQLLGELGLVKKSNNLRKIIERLQ